MKLVTEYLEKVIDFQRMAKEATDPKLKGDLQKQAEAYYKLAVDQARKSGQSIPPKPQDLS